MLTVGLVGARGHTGKELVAILSRRSDMRLVFRVLARNGRRSGLSPGT